MNARRILVLPLLLALAAATALADVPVREEQFIYSILAFNGKDYSGTFIQKNSDTLYLVADVDNFLTARNTFIYYWPLTEDWKTDSSVLNVPFQGTLELRGGREREPRIVASTRYTYYNVRGEYELNWKVAKGEEADQAWKKYSDLMDAYYASVQKYYQARALYEAMLNELTIRITKMREQGQDVSRLVEGLQKMSSPKEPEYPKDYVVPPRPVEEAYILNLPVGEYSIRFFGADGSIMEGSERKVVVFQKRRSEGTGLEVIPGDKWTRPVESTTPSSALYVDGSSELFVRPFLEQEYNDLYYERMQRNDAKGNPSVMKWVRTQQVPQARIEARVGGGQVEVVEEKPYYVEQVKGASLGYKIVPFDPEGAHKDKEPSLRAFQIPLGKDTTRVSLKVMDKNGMPLAGGERQIRVLRPPKAGFVALILALLPLAVMAVVLARRARRLTS
jgi:hypothetical protein